MTNLLVQNAISVAQNKVARTELDNGKNHPHVLRELQNLSDLLTFLGKTEEAKPIFWRILNIQLKQFGPLHIGNAKTLMSLGEIYEMESEISLAEQFYKEALCILEKNQHSNSDVKGLLLLKLHGIYKSNNEAENATAIEQRFYGFLRAQRNNDGTVCKRRISKEHAFVA